MAQRLLLAGTGLVVAAGLLLLVVNRTSVRQEVLPPPETNAAAEQPLPGAGEGPGFIGVVVANGSVDVSASVEGRLESVDVRVGDRVRKGGVLARLDARSLQHELSISQASLQAAHAEEEVARLSLAAAQESLQRGVDPRLVSMGALSEEDLARLRYAEKTAAAKLNVARAQVENQQARIEQLQLRISETTLRAPFDAKVSMRYLDPGTMVDVGSPIVHLLSEGPQVVRFAIPEEATARVTVGTPVRIGVRGQEPWRKGRVESVSPEVDAASRMVLAIASVAREDGAPLSFGAVVRVFVEDEKQAGQHPGP